MAKITLQTYKNPTTYRFSRRHFKTRFNQHQCKKIDAYMTDFMEGKIIPSEVKKILFPEWARSMYLVDITEYMA